MRRHQVLICILAFLFSLDILAASEGKPAPSFEAKLFDGTFFSLASNQGKVVIIHFWATWCDACKVEMPLLDKFYKLHHSEGLVLVAVNMDEDKKRPQAMEGMRPLSFQSTFAKDAHFKGYGRIWRLPLTFLIDRQGVLRKDGWTQSHVLAEKDLNETVLPLLHQ